MCVTWHARHVTRATLHPWSIGGRYAQRAARVASVTGIARDSLMVSDDADLSQLAMMETVEPDPLCRCKPLV